MKTKLHPVERNVGIREKCESSRLHVCEKIKVSHTFSNLVTKNVAKTVLIVTISVLIVMFDSSSCYSIYDKEYIGRITEHFGSR